jgi:hypothetical protein
MTAAANQQTAGAGTGKLDIREYPFGAGTNKVFRPRAAWRAG